MRGRTSLRFIVLLTKNILSCYAWLYLFEAHHPCDGIVVFLLSVVRAFGAHVNELQRVKECGLLVPKCCLFGFIRTSVPYIDSAHFLFDG